MQTNSAKIWLILAAVGATASLAGCSKRDFDDDQDSEWGGNTAAEVGGDCSSSDPCPEGSSCSGDPGKCVEGETPDVVVPSPSPNPSPPSSTTINAQGVLAANANTVGLIDGYVTTTDGPYKKYRAEIRVKDMTLDDFLQYGLMAVTHVKVIKHPDSGNASAKQEWNFYVPYNYAYQKMDVTGVADVEARLWMTSQEARAVFNDRRLDPQWPGEEAPDDELGSMGCGGNRQRHTIHLPSSAFELAPNNGDCAPFAFDVAFSGSSGNPSFTCKRSRLMNTTSDDQLVAICPANSPSCTPAANVACRPPLAGSAAVQINCWGHKWGNPQSIAAKATYNRLGCSATSQYNTTGTAATCTSSSTCGTDASGVAKLCLPGVNGVL